MRRSILVYLGPTALFAGVLIGCGLQLEALSTPSGDQPEPPAAATAQSQSGDPKVVGTFFDDDMPPGAYTYSYPSASWVRPTESEARMGEVSLEYNLSATEWSGAALAVSGFSFNLEPHLRTGALELWIKGERGGEKAVICLIDDKNSDGKQTAVRVPVDAVTSVTREWKLVRIALSRFGMKGAYWDEIRQVEVPGRFDWDQVAEIKIECKKDENPAFHIWVDDIVFRSNVFPPRELMVLWPEYDHEVPAPPEALPAGVELVNMLIDDGLPAGAATYFYDGQTYMKFMNTTSAGNKGVMAMFFDNDEYSGVSVNLTEKNRVDIKKVRDNGGGIGFWLKGGPGLKKVYLGLLDDDRDGHKTQTKRYIQEFGKIDTTWRYFAIPLKEFDTRGFYWDDYHKYEGKGVVDWTGIEEVRFSTQRNEAEVEKNTPAILYVDQISIIKKVPGYVNPEEYWASFSSDAPDILLSDFDSGGDHGWETDSDEGSKIEIGVTAAPSGGSGNALMVTHKIAGWIDITKKLEGVGRDWTRHEAVAMDILCNEAYRGLMIQAADKQGEVFYHNLSVRRGWNSVRVGLGELKKYDWQPEEAVENGRLELEAVTLLTIKPKGAGEGVLYLDNVRLTNRRDPMPPPPPSVDVTITGDPKTVLVERINPHLFGINIQARDPFMHGDRSERLLEEGRFSVIRYPGGLDADDYHWKERLEKGDPLHYDIDDFLALLKKTGAEGMITVNYGSGTPEEAAAWVRYVNIEREAGVKYWEIGNEVNLDFHPFFTTAEKYGPRAAEYIKAMKAVDPSIEVAVIFGEDDWNGEVWKHCAGLADATIRHSYPMGPPDEEDGYHLMLPSVLGSWVEGWKENAGKLAAEAGSAVPRIWLTEWNATWSTNERLIQWINGLFICDMLGTLARHNLEHADLWAIRNPIGPGFGDHGIVSRGVGESEGDNVPRPPYFGHQLAAEQLRGTMLECTSSDPFVSCYLTEDNGVRRLMVVNKHRHSCAELALDIPGFEGRAVVKQISHENARRGAEESRVKLSAGGILTAPPLSVLAITVEDK